MSEAFQALTTDYRVCLPYLARVIRIDGRRPTPRSGHHDGRGREAEPVPRRLTAARAGAP